MIYLDNMKYLLPITITNQNQNLTLQLRKTAELLNRKRNSLKNNEIWEFVKLLGLITEQHSNLSLQQIKKFKLFLWFPSGRL